MVYPKAFIDFLMYFHGNRDYFECHEILEEHWKEVDPRNRTSHWVGLIQVAVGFYHYRRGNLTGAERTFKKAVQTIQRNQKKLNELGVHSIKLHDMIVATIHQINLDQPYHSIDFPLTDDSLVDEVKTRCKDNGYTWCSPSDLSNTGLVHRHSYRDRSEVILERENALRKKRGRPPL